MSTYQTLYGEKLKWLGEVRDGFLVLVGVVYLSGYLVWSFHSWRNNLGLLPILQSQYLVAGIPPVLVLLGLYGSVRGLQKLRGALYSRSEAEPERPLWHNLILALWLLLPVAVIPKVWLIPVWFFGGVLLLDTYRPRFRGRNLLVLVWALALVVIYRFDLSVRLGDLVEARLPVWASVVGGVIFAIATYLLPPRPEWRSAFGFFRLMGAAYGLLLLVILPTLGFFYFVEVIYPRIPQELGGARPRCAQLDVEVTELSRPTLSALAAALSPGDDSTVTRTGKVEILYASDSFLILRPMRQSSTSRVDLVELRRDAIRAIHAGSC